MRDRSAARLAADGPRARHLSPGRVVRGAASGAIIATVVAVAAHSLGVPQLLRAPDVVLFFPAAIAGALIGGTRLRPLLWMAAMPVALTAIVVAYTPLTEVIARHSVRSDRISGGIDAIAILSGGINAEGGMRGQTLERLLSGISHAKRNLAPAVLISRERRSIDGRFVSSSADQQAILDLVGLDTEIVFVDSATNTRTEALEMRRIAGQRGWKKIALVTSPIHSGRACATFEAVGFEVVCLPGAARDLGYPSIRDPEDRLRAFRAWLYEMFAGATYRSRGWIK